MVFGNEEEAMDKGMSSKEHEGLTRRELLAMVGAAAALAPY
jgi:hypothetical protein